MTPTTAQTARRRARRAISLTFPAGFVELTTRREPRHAYWEQELATYYPELDRATSRKLLTLLDSQDLSARLGGLADDVRVAVGLVLDGRGIEGAVLLSVTALQTPAGWAWRDLARGLTAAARSRPALRLRELPCADAAAVLVDRGRRGEVGHTDLYLADLTLNAVVIVSAFGLASAPIDLLPTLTEITHSYQAL